MPNLLPLKIPGLQNHRQLQQSFGAYDAFILVAKIISKIPLNGTNLPMSSQQKTAREKFLKLKLCHRLVAQILKRETRKHCQLWHNTTHHLRPLKSLGHKFYQSSNPTFNLDVESPQSRISQATSANCGMKSKHIENFDACARSQRRHEIASYRMPRCVSGSSFVIVTKFESKILRNSKRANHTV